VRIWVTRTEPQAEETARRLEAMGHEPIVQPVLMVHTLPIDVTLTGVAALAFTSRNAVSAFCQECPHRELPVFATGAGTAQEAMQSGFGQVYSADGDVEALASLIISRRPAGLVLHPAAAEAAGDLGGALDAAGVACRTLAIYETVETGLGPPPDIEAVVIHSPRAARIVARSLSPEQAQGIEAYVISAAAAEPISYSNFRRVAVAPYPNEQALLKLFVR
jgi:uroporphyrinogen-III synthase